MRRFTRLTNGFSKKVENHLHSIALHFMYYNFCRVHQTLRVTPAMAAGVTDRLWEMTDIVKVLEDWETDMATAGTTYEVRPDRIPPGFHVAINSRYGKPETISGFPTIENAKTFIEAERAKHRPGRRRKSAA